MTLIARHKETKVRIIGTADKLLATAMIVAWNGRNPDGSLDFDYEGESRIHWDAQEAVTRDDKTVYVTEDWKEVPEDEIELVEDDDTART